MQDLEDLERELQQFCKKSRAERQDIESKDTEKQDKDKEKQTYYFLDEIQNLENWDKWVEGLYRRNIKIFAAGSNRDLLNLLRSEKLAGKCKEIRLFPFSFKEYLRLKGIKLPAPEFLEGFEKDRAFEHFLQYFDKGGFPEVLKNGDFRLSREYFEEILEKEVLEKYGIRDTEEKKGIRKLAVFLFSNVACEYSFETLKSVSGAESPGTVRRWLAYLENAFLLYRVSGLTHCPEPTGIAFEKAYAGDTGFFKTVASNYPDSLGLRFENLVLLELLRRGEEVFYFHDKRECDFVVRNNLKVSGAV